MEENQTVDVNTVWHSQCECSVTQSVSCKTWSRLLKSSTPSHPVITLLSLLVLKPLQSETTGYRLPRVWRNLDSWLDWFQSNDNENVGERQKSGLCYPCYLGWKSCGTSFRLFSYEFDASCLILSQPWDIRGWVILLSGHMWFWRYLS